MHQLEFASMDEKKAIGVVVIGRNEGERLQTCLDSIVGKADCIVYVDSASSDGSAEVARNAGIDAIELDNSQPYTAARSRNAGYSHIRELMPALDFVQFVDGDCIVDPDWLDAAAAFMGVRTDVAAVCGRLRERFPDKTVYNLLCDMEWDLPSGETGACGGNAFMRAEIFQQSGGFREDLIAGEEPELCLRLRDSGWKIWRLRDEMVLHDADMTHFSQFWTRSVRAGYTFAEGVHRLGRDCRRERNRALVWGLGIPVILILGSLLSVPMALFSGSIYLLQMLRLASREKFGYRNNMIYAWFEVLGRFPEMCGVIKYYFNLATGRTTDLIEYKKPLAVSSNPDKNEN
jgi:GT2 family glycosyltransferase